MMKKLILFSAALALAVSSNLVGADSTRHKLSQLAPPPPDEPSTPALLLIAAGLLVLRMRKQSNDAFVGK